MLNYSVVYEKVSIVPGIEGTLTIIFYKLQLHKIIHYDFLRE